MDASLLLPQTDYDAWTRIAAVNDGARALITFVPIESDANTIGTFIESQISPAQSLDVDAWTAIVAGNIEAAGYGGKVTVSNLQRSEHDAVVTFRYEGDAFVTPFVEAYRLLDTEAAFFLLTVRALQGVAGDDAPPVDAARLVLESRLVPVNAIGGRAPTADSGPQRRDIEDFIELLSRFGGGASTAPAIAILDDEARRLAAEETRQRDQRRANALAELAQILAYAVEHTSLMPDPRRWLASRDLLVQKALTWIGDESSLDGAADRRRVLDVVARICQYGVDVAYAVRRRYPDLAGLAGISESFCEARLKLDFCTSALLGTNSLTGIGDRIQVLRHSTRDAARAMRLEILAHALTFVETLSAEGTAHDPDELWSSIAAQPRGLELLDAIHDVGGLLLGIGRLASDSAWQVASFVLDAALLLEHPMETLGGDMVNERAGRMYELQRAASCHAHGITVDEYVTSNALMVQRRQGPPPPHHALFLRNVRSARRYMMANRFTPHPALREWPIEPPRVSLESALNRALPNHVLAVSVGGGWDCLGMARLATVGGPSSRSESWRTIVTAMLERSQTVLMVPSDSEGVRWEVGQIRSMGMLPHTVWVMPPADALPSGEREWDRGRTGLASLGVELPAYQREGAFVLLDAAGAVRSQEPFDCLWNGGLTELITHKAWRVP